MSLSAEEIAKRKAYLEITPDDERRLREAHPHLQSHTREIIDRFYDYLFAHEHTRQMLSEPGLVDRLKKLQIRYFDELTSGDYGPAYFENRLRVGEVHNRVGLAPQWYLGAYTKYLHIVSDVLSRAFGRDYERFYQTLISLTKVINLDMSLSLDAYIHGAQNALQHQKAALEGAHAQLLKVESARRQLTDMIVHDLQNPLAGIAAFLKVLEPSEHLSPSIREALQEALRRCADLSQMILNVLQVSRAEEGKLATYVENVDLARLASESAAAFKLAAEVEGRTVEVELPDEVPLRTDQSLIRRVLYNLIRNALRHTPKGTRVIVRAERLPGSGARLTVADDGPGIALEAQPLLFERFGAPALRQAGLRVDSGLGLAFCKAAADAVGATLRVESDGRRGTKFVMDFP
ncbi:MAG TPA: protoglobin domain-containing protein [Planctomycetota bacterium]|nr:protoglobin domain-containing protein [Planctomycetota bacterium]